MYRTFLRRCSPVLRLPLRLGGVRYAAARNAGSGPTTDFHIADHTGHLASSSLPPSRIGLRDTDVLPNLNDGSRAFFDASQKMATAIGGLSCNLDPLTMLVPSRDEKMLDYIVVESYRGKFHLWALATVSLCKPASLLVYPRDPKDLHAIHKAILSSSVGFNPTICADRIIVPFPPLTGEFMKSIRKCISEAEEEAKLYIRNAYQKAIEAFRAVGSLPKEELEELEEKIAILAAENWDQVEQTCELKACNIFNSLNTGHGFVDEERLGDLMLDFDRKQPDFDERVKENLQIIKRRRLPIPPKGTHDFAKEQMMIRERALSIITEVFKRHAATALDTPASRETVLGNYGEGSKQIYDLADQGGELSSLRYDASVPFARYVAMNGITSCKRYQIAKVYQRDDSSNGRCIEFYQCDFDIAGQYEEEMSIDFEIIKILTELLDELHIGDYEVKLNHRKLLDGMLEICGVPPEKFCTICSSIDKLDKQSFDQVKKEMVEEKGLSVEIADNIGAFAKERGQPKELLSKLKQEGSKFLENASSKRALEELEILFDALDKSKCIGRVVFDLSLARGLDYYTGVIFETVFKGTTQVGPIATGGRYDKLIGKFGTKQVPAVGVSLGIEQIFAIMEQLQKDRNQANGGSKIGSRE